MTFALNTFDFCVIPLCQSFSINLGDSKHEIEIFDAPYRLIDVALIS